MPCIRRRRIGWRPTPRSSMMHQHIPSIRSLNALAFDVGTQDVGIAQACERLDQILTDYGIPHTYEAYDGDHLNRIAERIQTHVLPFFTEALAFE